MSEDHGDRGHGTVAMDAEFKGNIYTCIIEGAAQYGVGEYPIIRMGRQTWFDFKQELESQRLVDIRCDYETTIAGLEFELDNTRERYLCVGETVMID